MESAERGTPRIAILDGFRAVAIIFVMLFHYFTVWKDLYPYGDAFAGWFSHGYLGVHFFFIISGFVISMTLCRCATPSEFAVKRFARLWECIVGCGAIGSPGDGVPCVREGVAGRVSVLPVLWRTVV